MNKKLMLLALINGDPNEYDSMIELNEYRPYINCIHVSNSKTATHEFVNLESQYINKYMAGFIGKCNTCGKIYYFIPNEGK